MHRGNVSIEVQTAVCRGLDLPFPACWQRQLFSGSIRGKAGRKVSQSDIRWQNEGRRLTGFAFSSLKDVKSSKVWTVRPPESMSSPSSLCCEIGYERSMLHHHIDFQSTHLSARRALPISYSVSGRKSDDIETSATGTSNGVSSGNMTLNGTKTPRRGNISTLVTLSLPL